MLIIFDLDGTLVDTSGDIVRVVNAVLVENGHPEMSRAGVMDCVGRGTPYLLAQVLGREPGEEVVEAARRRFVDLYSREPVRDSAPYPGTRETLDALVTEHQLALASNKSSRLVQSTVQAVGLHGYFYPVLGGDDLGELKPSPEGLRRVMEMRGASPSSTAMVGDMDLDIRAGRGAGVRTVFASYGFGVLAETDPRPDAIIDGISRLPDVIRGWESTPRG